MSEDPSYHHGLTIRTYRTERGLTQAQLAARWPGGPVNPHYVQRVETGKKRIADQETLRRLSELLDIPLWRFGLSEYDPFHPHNLPGAGTRMYAETLDAVECILQQAWSLRTVGLLPNAEQCTGRLNALFAHFQRELPPPARLGARVLALSAQVSRLNAVCAVERGDYMGAVARYREMYDLARQLGDPGTLAMALTSLSSELSRPRQTLVLSDEITRQIAADGDRRLATWIPLDWARAYLLLGEPEAAVTEARAFAAGVTAMGSPHAHRQVNALVRALEAAGYGGVAGTDEIRVLARTNDA